MRMLETVGIHLDNVKFLNEFINSLLFFEFELPDI